MVQQCICEPDFCHLKKKHRKNSIDAKTHLLWQRPLTLCTQLQHLCRIKCILNTLINTMYTSSGHMLPFDSAASTVLLYK